MSLVAQFWYDTSCLKNCTVLKNEHGLLPMFLVPQQALHKLDVKFVFNKSSFSTIISGDMFPS